MSEKLTLTRDQEWFLQFRVRPWGWSGRSALSTTKRDVSLIAALIKKGAVESDCAEIGEMIRTTEAGRRALEGRGHHLLDEGRVHLGRLLRLGTGADEKGSGEEKIEFHRVFPAQRLIDGTCNSAPSACLLR